MAGLPLRVTYWIPLPVRSTRIRREATQFMRAEQVPQRACPRPYLLLIFATHLETTGS